MLKYVKQGFGLTVGHTAGMLAIGIALKLIEKRISKVEKAEAEHK